VYALANGGEPTKENIFQNKTEINITWEFGLSVQEVQVEVALN
jgi:hypothetical protein